MNVFVATSALAVLFAICNGANVPQESSLLQTTDFRLQTFADWRVSWNSDLDFAGYPECPAITERMLTHERHMATLFPQRRPLVFAPVLNGLGDRLKGLFSAMVLAVLVGRPFRILTTPQFSSDFVVPSTFDWRLPELGNPVAPLHSLKNRILQSDEEIFLDQFHHGQAGSLFQYHATVVSKSNRFLRFDASMCDEKVPAERKLYACVRNVSVTAQAKWSSMLAYCAFATLFRPNATLVARLQSLLAPALAPPPNSLRLLISVHTRFGGIHTDPARAGDSDAVQLIGCALAVAREWAAKYTAPGRTLAVGLVLASDQPPRLRALVTQQSERTGHVPVPNMTLITAGDADGAVLHNMDGQRGTQDASLYRGWIDFFLLNQAHVGVYFRSGFSRMAITSSENRARCHGQRFEFDGHRKFPTCRL